MNGIDQQSIQQPAPTQTPPTTPIQPTPVPSSFFGRNKLTIAIVAVFIFLIILIVVVLLFLFKGSGGEKKVSSPIQQATGSATKSAVPADPTAGWKTYTNSDLGFYLLYPPEWSVKEEKSKTNQASETQAQPVVSWASPSNGFTKPVNVSISYYKSQGQVDLNNFVSERLKNISFTKDLPRYDGIAFVGGAKGIMSMYSAKDTNGQVNIYGHVFVLKGDKIFQIIGSVGKESGQANLFRPFNQLLATFLFD